MITSFLSAIPRDTKYFLMICIPVILLCYLFGLYQFYNRSFIVSTPQELEMHWQNDTIVAGLMSACIFLLFRQIQEPGIGYRLIRSISSASYGMYLMHMLMLPAIFGLLDPLMPVPLAIVLTAILTYGLSYLISSLMGKLPFGKYIVG